MAKGMPKVSIVFEKNLFLKVVQNGITENQCAICKTSIAGSTSTLMNHLVSKHPEDSKVIENLDQLKKSDNTERKRPVDNTPRISDVFKSNKIEENVMDERFVEIVVAHNLPLNFGESPFVRKMFSATDHNFKPLNHKALKLALDNYSKKVYDIQKEKIKSVKFFALTADIWTTRNMKHSYIAVYLHFLTKEFKREKILIGFRSLGSLSHAGDTISAVILNCLKKYGIDIKMVVVFVSDGAKSNIRAASLLDINWKHCLAHVLNLVVQNGIKSSKELVKLTEQSRKIVSTFHKSQPLSSALKEAQTNEEKALCQDVPTRWNSTFYMLRSLIENYSSIRMVSLNKDPKVSKLFYSESLKPFKATELDLAEKFCKILDPFEKATKKASDESELLSSYFCIAIALKKKLDKLLSECSSDEEEELIKALKEKLEQYFFMSNGVESDDILLATLLLDVRYSLNETVLSTRKWNEIEALFIVKATFHFVNEQQMYSEEIDDNQALIKDHLMQDENANNVNHEDDLFDFSARPSQNLSQDAHTIIENKLKAEMNVFKSLVKESQIFPNADVTNVYEFYRVIQRKVPMISELARKYFCIPCSSVDCERFFSQAGLLLANNRRGRLSEETIEILMTIKDYLCMKNKLEEEEQETKEFDEFDEEFDHFVRLCL